MIIKLKKDAKKAAIDKLVKHFQKIGFALEVTKGEFYTAVHLLGDTSSLDIEAIKVFDIVDNVTRLQEPYKKANRKTHPEDTVVDVDGIKIGGGHFEIMAGPCSVEGEKQIVNLAIDLKKLGIKILRGGAFKPRTSPYTFQGLGVRGLDYLIQAKKETGMKIVTEIMDLSTLDLFNDVDIIQVGARNMQNFELLKGLGETNKPIILKRGLANTYEELLMSAEYILSRGNKQVILCERGIRTFEKETRNTLDISAVPILKELTHLPIIVDPSHAVGIARFVPALAKAGVVVGADGLMIEVHNDPENALSDGLQSLKVNEFKKLVKEIENVRKIVK